MAQDKITFRTDSEDKKNFEAFVSSLGLTTSSALNMIIKNSLREKRLPVTLSLAPSMPYDEREELTSLLQERIAYAKRPDAVRITNEALAQKLGLL